MPFNDSSSASALAELRNVTFGYGERVILRDVSLKIPRGKVTALMGASGGGKTTVLRLIGGQHRAQQGEVLFDRQDVGRMDAAGLYAARRRMGMLFQFGALFTDLTVFENVAFPLREHTDLSDALVRDIVLMKLHAVGLRGARDLMPSQISGGMARRVALARAIALDPELVMYDEPFAGLDPISLGTAAQLIRQLNDAMGLGAGVALGQVLAQNLQAGLQGDGAAAQAAPAAAAPVGVKPEDVMATLEKLGELKSKGILTQEEFDAKKAELLKKLV